jgi:hypothetical protein
MILEKLQKLLYSEEGKKSVTEYFDKINQRKDIENKQLERLDKINDFSNFVEKTISKYGDDKYRDRWYNRNITPPEDLFWFLFKYSEKYGRTCDEKEWELYGNMFSSALYFCKGYYFNRMDGQGSMIDIIKAI